MKIVKTISELPKFRKKVSSVGFVPTMGYLHEGHLSLVRAARKENQLVVVSIFVNPAQFGPNEDFQRYPRDIERDRLLLEKEDVDLLFIPDSKEIYPPDYKTYVEVTGWSNKLCGKFRPGHFRGVTTIVLKLFNIIQPAISYFGQKDAQQAIIIKKMAQDLNLETEIKVLPTVRDADGLALSSRNTYLSPAERKTALLLPQSLKLAQEKINSGEYKAGRIIRVIKNYLSANSKIKIEYIKIVSLKSLEDLKYIEPDNTLVAVAVRVGNTRLIDNFVLGVI